MNLKQSYRRIRSNRAGAVALATVLLVLLILVNLLVSLLPYSVTQADISGAGLYSISGTAKSFLKKLNEDVTIYCLTKDGGESFQLSTLLSRYTSASKHIRVQYVDAANDPAFCQKYGLEVSNITESSLVVESARRYEYIDYDSMIYYYSQASGKIGVAEYLYMSNYYSQQGASMFQGMYGFNFTDLVSYFDGDSKITNAIEYVTRDELSYTLTLSADTKSFLGTVKEPVAMYCIWSDAVSECQIAGVLDQYAAENKNITVTYVDPNKAENAAFIEKYFDKTPDEMTVVVIGEKRDTTITWSDVVLYHHAKLGTLSATEYASYLAMENQIYNQLGGQLPYGYCYAYFLYTQGAIQATDLFNITSITSYFDGEEAYTEAIDYVTQETIPHAYVLTGSFGTPLTEKLADFFLESGTDYAELDPETVGSIPEDASALMIYAPLRDLTADEAEKINAYLEKGGHLLLFTDASDLGYENLMGILSSYGVNASANTVRDDAEGKYFGTHDLLIPTINTGHQINRYPVAVGYQIYMPAAHELTVAEKLPEKVTVKNLLTTSEKGGYITFSETDGNGDSKQVTERGTYTLAVDIQKEDTGAVILWYASTEMLSDAFILENAEENNGNPEIRTTETSAYEKCGNKYFVALSVSYLGRAYTPLHKASSPVASDVADPDRYTIPAIRMTMEYLNITSLVPVILLGILLVILLPGTIIAAGVVIRNRRRKA